MMLTDHFSRAELQCRCPGNCPSAYQQDGLPLCNIDPRALEKHELFRVRLGVPYTPTSACRCPIHNARVGGAPFSQHRATLLKPWTAFDVPLVAPKADMIRLAGEVGFLALGVNYRTFLHMDDRPYKVRF